MRRRVREQESADHVADGMNGVDRRAHPFVRLDEPVGMRGHTDLLEADVFRARSAPYRDQELAGPHLALLGVDADPVSGLLRALDAHPDAAIDTRLLESAEHLFGDLLVLEGDETIEGLQQGDLDAELVVEGREL